MDGVPTSLRSLQVSIWAPSLGFTLLFGSLIVKTWRIYHIFGKIMAKKFNKAKFKVRMIVSVCVCVLLENLYVDVLCLLSALAIPSLPPPYQPPKDWMLLLVIAAMVVVDVVFLLIVTAVDSSRFYATEERTTVSLSLTT